MGLTLDVILDVINNQLLLVHRKLDKLLERKESNSPHQRTVAAQKRITEGVEMIEVIQNSLRGGIERISCKVVIDSLDTVIKTLRGL